MNTEGYSRIRTVEIEYFRNPYGATVDAIIWVIANDGHRYGRSLLKGENADAIVAALIRRGYTDDLCDLAV